MCAGCPGGREVSPATAYLNHNRMKLAVLAELRRAVGRRATITVFGARWVLRSRTGVQQIFPDLEALAEALVGKHDGVEVERSFENMTEHGARALDARRFVQALLVDGAAGGAGHGPFADSVDP